MKRELNKLEQLQKEENNIEFIKSYPTLKKVLKSQLEKDIIELVLSFQHNDKPFHMNYKNIANILVCKVQSVRNTINKLKRCGYLITENTSNFNGTGGGSSTSLMVDIELVINDITNGIPKSVSKEVTKEVEVIIPEPIVEIIQEDIVETTGSQKLASRAQLIKTLESFQDRIYNSDYNRITEEIMMTDKYTFSTDLIEVLDGLESDKKLKAELFG